MGRRRQAVRIKSSGPGFVARCVKALRPLQRPFLVWFLPIVAFVAICGLGMSWARYRVAASPRYQIVAPRLTLPEPAPAWWEKDFEKQINASVAFADGMSIFDPAVLEQVAAAYRRCPWVKEVLSVEKRFPNQICARIRPRWPAAAVVYPVSPGFAFYLVDEEGVQLPKVYAKWPPPGLNIPRIFGVGAARPARPGNRWEEPSVADAIEVLRLLQSSDVIRKAIHIVGLDVANYGGRLDRSRSEIVVLADNNCSIDWGRPPRTDQPGELPVREKILKLERYLREEGNPTSHRRIDIRFAGRVVVSRRLEPNGDSG